MKATRATLLGLMTLALASCGGGLGTSRAEVTQAVTYQTVPDAGWDAWVASFRSRASGQGISGATLDAAFRNAGFVPEVIERDRNQAEFNLRLWQYLDRAVSDTRVSQGRDAVARTAGELAEIENRYGVDRHVVAAVWGLESSYGTNRGTIPVVSALSTLAYEGRRASFFEQQLVGALRILQNGDVSPDRMTGSWAGAMGHTQFIPTSFLSLAVDFRGDGRRDIWSDDPIDALASTANYLRQSGWQTGQPWGVEVVVPEGASTGGTRLPSAWAAAGIRAADGASIRDYGPASILRPEGASGPAFMTFRNFEAIKRYNGADSYVIAVGHLSDRLRGGAPLRTVFPQGDRPLSEAERMELQRLLTAMGYDTGGTDGRVGPATVEAVRAWQRANGESPDGYPTGRLLDRLRAS